jgi:hypothetical protein
MAETLISPGVLARENDQSQVTQGPISVGAAIIGPAVKGPVGIPTLVTSYSDYQNKFGTTFTSGGAVYSFFTSITAYNYFNNGGESLLVTRVASGSFTPASSSIVSGSSTSPVFTLETLNVGAGTNNSGSELTGGILVSGSQDNVRWQIVSPDTSSGTFTLLVRRGDDNASTPTILETWSNLSLDPFASNYIEAVIGNQIQQVRSDGSTFYVQTTGSYVNKSRYIRVRSVSLPTPNYLNSLGSINSASDGTPFSRYIPLTGSGSFGGAAGNIIVTGGQNYYESIPSTAANIQGVGANDYTQSIALLSNQDDYRYNLLVAPGLNTGNAASQITSIISNCQNRGDAMAVIDVVTYGAQIGTVTSNAQGYNNSYAATYWPWLQTIDPDSGKQVWVPASTMIPGVYAFNDRVSEPWFAPAGINRGGLSTVIQAERKIPQSDRDTLYIANVNPIATFPGTGVVVYGQKTLQKAASALDRVNVRRLLIALKSYITQVSLNLVFEQNTAATRNNFLAQVNPYLESVQQRQGLFAFKVVMDDTNNTADVIDRNQLVGQIYLQPTKTAEFILLDFNILPTGATFG